MLVNLPARIRPVHPVLLYDDHCKFCRASAALVHGWDRDTRLDFLPLSDPLAASLLSPMSEAERMESIHVVQPDGTISSAGQALLSLCAELPAASLLARASSAAAPVAAGTKALYDALSAVRGSLTKSSRSATRSGAGAGRHHSRWARKPAEAQSTGKMKYGSEDRHLRRPRTRSFG